MTGNNSFSTIAFTPVFINAEDIGLSLADNVSLQKFQEAWDFLKVDSYVRNSNNPRRRRHCIFKYVTETNILTREPDGIYYQSVENNSLYGGLARSFAPVDVAFSVENPWFEQLLRFNVSNLPLNYPELLINCHFVRITSLSNAPGEPAPEGIHRDGFEYISIHLINKTNCIGGETTIFNNERKPLLNKTLENPFDSIYFNDQNCLHHTSPIYVGEESKLGTRDVILCSYEHYFHQ
jgi:hypothetical protein